MFDFNRIVQTAVNGIKVIHKEDSSESDIAVASSDDEEIPIPEIAPNNNTVSSSILAVKGTV